MDKNEIFDLLIEYSNRKEEALIAKGNINPDAPIIFTYDAALALCEQLTAATAYAERAKGLAIALDHLIRDCMASDFNEHWSSYKNAIDALNNYKTPTNGK